MGYFITLLAVYLLTLSPSVQAGNSGGLIYSVVTFTVKGFFLYCLPGGIFLRLPVSSIAYRLNLMSAFFSSLAVYLFYRLVLGCLVKRLNVRATACLPFTASVLMLGFSQFIWHRAVRAGGFPVLLFLTAYLLFIVLNYPIGKKHPWRTFFLFALSAAVIHAFCIAGVWQDFSDIISGSDIYLVLLVLWLSAAFFRIYFRNRKTSLLISTFVFFLPFSILSENYTRCNRAESYLAHDYGKNLLKSLPEKIVLFISEKDDASLLAYFCYAEKTRVKSQMYGPDNEYFTGIYGTNMDELSFGEQQWRRFEAQRKFITPEISAYYTRPDRSLEWSGLVFVPDGLLLRVGASGTSGVLKVPELRIPENISGMDKPSKLLLARYYRAVGDEKRRCGDSNAEIYEAKAKELTEKIKFPLDPAWEKFLNGNELLKQGRLEQAAEEFTDAAKIDPCLLPARMNSGRIFESLGRLNDAADAYSKAVEASPESVAGYIGVSRVLRRQDKLDKALDEMRRAVRINGESAEAHVELGNLLMDANSIDDAITEFRTALTIRPCYPDAHYHLGVAYERKGWIDKAVLEWEGVK